MHSWMSAPVPTLPGTPRPLRLHDTATAGRVTVHAGSDAFGLYVCGITPYDATHMGHAATYVAFDTLQRVARDLGRAVRYAQNVTDVDDPLLERAAATGVDWRGLAAEQVDLFRGDMQTLRVLAPDEYVGVTEGIDAIADAVRRLLDADLAYRFEDGDVYFDTRAASGAGPWTLGDESGLDEATMLALSAERGGDPDRAGKRDPLDPLLWRGPRLGEPSWRSAVGDGRPGWHIECSVIAAGALGLPFDVQGGGSDLVFPHHEFSAGHAAALDGLPLARAYAHAGLVAYEGEKMSKSLGNLVLVSRLTAAGTDPAAIRLTLLGQHYRGDWEWTAALLAEAQQRLERWRSAVSGAAEHDTSEHDAALLERVRVALADDLDTPAALRAVDDMVVATGTLGPLAVDAIDALLGVELRG